MILRLRLPHVTYRRLLRATKVQVACLRYAATLTPIPPGIPPATPPATPVLPSINWTDFAALVDRQPTLSGSGSSIAAWVQNSPESLTKYLRQFANGPIRDKDDWVDRIQGEIDQLLRVRPAGPVSRFDPATASPWANGGAEFLKLFYDRFVQENGLPEHIAFPTRRYSRQDFLESFRRRNRHVRVCPICDEAPLFTRDGTHLRGSVDHFFPRKFYPHLSVHPLNLVPVCDKCNEQIKRDVDPAEPGGGGTRRTYDQLPIPYRASGLRSVILASFTQVHPQPLSVHLEVRRASPLAQQRLAVLEEMVRTIDQVYALNSRWNSRRAAAHRVATTLPAGNTVRVADNLEADLYRRAVAYLRTEITGQVPAPVMLSRLNEMIADVQHNDVGVYPDSFLFAWWLAAQANILARPGAASAFLDTLNATYWRRPQLLRRFSNRGIKLRSYHS